LKVHLKLDLQDNLNSGSAIRNFIPEYLLSKMLSKRTITSVTIHHSIFMKKWLLIPTELIPTRMPF